MKTVAIKSRSKKPCALPRISKNKRVWFNTIKQERAELNLRKGLVFQAGHENLAITRALLIDLMICACAIRRFSRNTCHLSIDLFDRYLSINMSMTASNLKLLGITCIFIAAKMEEIDVPTISYFTYLCQGATIDNIKMFEIVVLNALEWRVNVMTSVQFLNSYMDMYHSSGKMIHKGDLGYQYPQSLYVRGAHIIDLFSMDPNFFKYDYSVIAAGAIYYLYGKQAALATSGLRWNQLESCINYMSVFDKMIKHSNDSRFVNVPIFKKKSDYVAEDHYIQTHVFGYQYYLSSVMIRNENLFVGAETMNADSVQEETSSAKEGVPNEHIADGAELVQVVHNKRNVLRLEEFEYGLTEQIDALDQNNSRRNNVGCLEDGKNSRGL